MTWFDIGTPATFGTPANPSLALAFGAPDPTAPEGVGNLGNFLYVGTSTGKVYVSQNAGGSWTSISTGLDGSAVKQIITDPARGSHDAYAVTQSGVYYLANSITSAGNATPTWVNITGGLKTLAYSIFGQSYDPATDPNASKYDLATVLNSIAANWNYVIPNNPANLSQGYHPVLYVAANSGVYMSTDQGQSWVLYPSTTYGATVDGGDLPHVNVTSLSLSQGNIASATGMPALAGPYNPQDPDGHPGPRPAAGRHLRRRRLRHQPGADDPRRHGADRLGRYRRDRARRHPDRHDRHALHRRAQRALRLRQRHLGHDRR